MTMLRNRPFVTTLVLALMLSALGTGIASAGSPRGNQSVEISRKVPRPTQTPYSGEPDVTGQGAPQPSLTGSGGPASLLGPVPGLVQLWVWSTAKIWLLQHPRTR